MAKKVNAHAAGIEGLLKRLLAQSELGRASRTAIDTVGKSFAEVSSTDYPRRLRHYFSTREMRTLLAAMELNLPALNRKSFSNTDIDYLRAVAQSLQAELRAIPFGLEMGDLRGFYAPTSLVGKRPIIFINTEYDRVAVASTFWHEMGHHLMDRLGQKAKSVQVMSSTEFSARLSSASELIAETVVALACYPKPAAIGLFERDLKRDHPPDAYDLVVRARRHLNALSHFELENEFPPAGDLRYLVGMVHYARLRWALLREYGI